MFGLDPDSMVYADADGNLAGPGMNLETDFVLPSSIETMTAEEESEFASSAGRVRSNYVGPENGKRKGPY